MRILEGRFEDIVERMRRMMWEKMVLREQEEEDEILKEDYC